jgi:hypothetical protein
MRAERCGCDDKAERSAWRGSACNQAEGAAASSAQHPTPSRLTICVVQLILEGTYVDAMSADSVQIYEDCCCGLSLNST